MPIVSALVAGCAAAVSNPATVFKAVCPVLKQYDPDFLAQVDRELDSLPNNSALGRMVDDYLNLRDQVRACRGIK